MARITLSRTARPLVRSVALPVILAAGLALTGCVSITRIDDQASGPSASAPVASTGADRTIERDLATTVGLDQRGIHRAGTAARRVPLAGRA